VATAIDNDWLYRDRATHLHAQVETALREGLTEFAKDRELIAPASTWIVTATAPHE
jgi:hypothetical protein